MNYGIDDEEDKVKIDPRLETFYNSIVQDALDKNEFNSALGISLETMRIDMVESIIR